MKVKVYNTKGETVGEQELDPQIFGVKINPVVVQQAVVAQQANARAPIAHTKGRGEVRGGGKKPWAQKGTGRARHGSIRSPLWRGGGITFGPTKFRNFSIKINKKAKRAALLMALSDRAQDQKIILLDKLELEKPKTKIAFAVLQNLKLRVRKVRAEKDKKPAAAEGLKKAETLKREQKGDNNKAAKMPKETSVLLVLPQKLDEIKRAFRNLPRLEIINADSLNVVDVLKNQVLLMPTDSLNVIKKTYLRK